MTRIAVFGEMLVDQFEAGAVVGGAPFNVARHLAAFGHEPLMISAVGHDAHGALLLAEMQRYGMQGGGVQRLANHATGLVDVAMQANGDHEFHIRSNSAWDFIDAAAAHAAAAALGSTGWLYAGSLALRSATSRAAGLGLLQAHGGPVYVDLNWREGQVSREVALQAIDRADVLKLNDLELAMLCQWFGIASVAGLPEPSHVRQLLGKLSPKELLLVTCGAEGALAFDGAGECTARSHNTRRIELVDTVGAGDSFSAVALAGLLRGWNIGTTLQRANDFAGHICEVRGAVPSDLKAYPQWTGDWS